MPHEYVMEQPCHISVLHSAFRLSDNDLENDKSNCIKIMLNVIMELAIYDILNQTSNCTYYQHK